LKRTSKEKGQHKKRKNYHQVEESNHHQKENGGKYLTAMGTQCKNPKETAPEFKL
jgi:hypothetical protein